MSITFFIAGECDHSDANRLLNLSNRNARGLLRWLGLPSTEAAGSKWALDLIPLIHRRLWPELTGDAGVAYLSLPARRAGNGQVIDHDIPAGYYPARAKELLIVAQLAGANDIVWG